MYYPFSFFLAHAKVFHNLESTDSETSAVEEQVISQMSIHLFDA